MANESSISPSSNMDISDTTSDTNQPTTGADAVTPSTDQPAGGDQPSASVSAPAPVVPQPNQAGNSQPQSGQQQPQPNMAKGDPNQPALGKSTPPPADPAVAHASRFYSVAQALAGGPRYKESVDVNTGEMTRTQVPLSRGDIGMAIALEAISGALGGLTQTGPGATGRAASAGFQQVSQEQQQAQQQQDQQANANYARHAQVVDNNLRMLQIAQTVGQKDFETNQQLGAQYKPLADQIQKDYPQYVKGVGGESDASKYDSTKETAIPTGNVIPVFDPQTGKQSVGAAGNKLWQQEYMFVDPSFKGDKLLTDQDRDMAQKYGILPKGKLPDSLPMKLTMALNIKHRVSTISMADQQLQDYYKSTGGDPKSFTEAIKSDPTIVDAMEKFQPLLAATQGDIGHAIGELAAGGQGRQGDSQAAGKMLNLYGGTSMVRKYDQEQANTKEEQKKVTDRRAAYDGPLSTQIAESIMSDTNASAEQKQRASGFLKSDSSREITLATSKAGAEARARTQAEIDVKKANGIPLGGDADSFSVSDPALAHLVTSSNIGQDGLNHPLLDAMKKTNPQRASLVEAIANGQRLESFYGLAKKDGQALAADVQAVDPSFDQSKVQGWNNFVSKEMTPGGKVGSRVVAANTALNHLDNLVHNVGWLNSMAQGVKGADLIHIPGYAAVKADKEGLSTEIAKYYKGASPDKEAMENLNKVLSGNPDNVKDGATELAKLLHGGLDSLHTQAESYRPSDHVKMPAFVTPKGAASYKAVTGEDIDQTLLGSGHVQSSATQGSLHPQVAPPAGAVGTMKSADGTSHYVNAQRQSLGVVPSQ